MNRKTVIISFVASFLTSLSYSQKPTPRPAVTWYKVMTGVIDTYPVTMYLFRKNDQVDGQYYYDKAGQPIGFSGTLTGDKLELTTGEEKFSGNVTDSTFFGSWTTRGKMLPVRLHTADRSKGFLSFSYVWVKGTQKRLKPYAESPDGPSYETLGVWPTDSDSLSTFLKREIFKVFGFNGMDSLTLGQALLKDKQAYLHWSNKEMGDNLLSFERSNAFQVQYQDSKLISFKFPGYEYAGGAHGSEGTLYFVYSLGGRRQLKIFDVIDTIRYGQTVSRLMESQYRRDYHLAADGRLSETPREDGLTLDTDTIPVSGNFFLTGKGIGFTYNDYEIGPYVLGSTSFFFTYKDLMPYLRPEFKKWMGLE